MNEIKNVIFDLGGVLVDLDIERCTAAFREIGRTSCRERV